MEIYIAMDKFLFGGIYDYGRRNRIDLNDTFTFLGFDSQNVKDFAEDMRKELKLSEDYKLIANLNMSLHSFLSRNCLYINQKLTRIEECITMT